MGQLIGKFFFGKKNVKEGADLFINNGRGFALMKEHNTLGDYHKHSTNVNLEM